MPTKLSVGHGSFLTSDESKKTIEDQVAIPPGQVGILITDEIVKIPLDTICLISIKAGIKFRGLVNISGFHVDPGFQGRLKFSVYNAGNRSIVLARREPAFLIWFCKLDQETTDKYDGDHMGQLGISSEDVMRIHGDIASPAQLKKEIEDVQKSLSHVKYILTALFAAIVAALLRNVPWTDIFPPPRLSPPVVQSAGPEGKPVVESATPPIPKNPKESVAPADKLSETTKPRGR